MVLVILGVKRAVSFQGALTGLFRRVFHYGVVGRRCIGFHAVRLLRQHHHVGVPVLVVAVDRHARAAFRFQVRQLLAVAVHLAQARGDDRALNQIIPLRMPISRAKQMNIHAIAVETEALSMPVSLPFCSRIAC